MGNRKVCFVIYSLVFVGLTAISDAHEVATSHQSVISGEGWRYSYGIAHGPHGIGHAVGESYPHGYGGFGAYAPAFGYTSGPVVLPHPPPPPPPPPPLPLEHVIIPAPYPHQFVHHPRPIPLAHYYKTVHPYYGYPHPHYLNTHDYYYYDDDDDHDDDDDDDDHDH